MLPTLGQPKVMEDGNSQDLLATAECNVGAAAVNKEAKMSFVVVVAAVALRTCCYFLNFLQHKNNKGLQAWNLIL